MEPSTEGHRIEYYHHLYNKATEKVKDEFIFVVDNSFKTNKDRFEWSEAKNIKIVELDENDTKNIKGSPLKIAWAKTILLHKIIKKYRPDVVLLIELLYNMPFSALLVSLLYPSIKISGIICQVYTYRWQRFNFISKIIYGFIFYILGKWKCFEDIYILNDSSAVAYFNKKFHSNHFKYLPDPIIPIKITNELDIRTMYNIPNDKIVFCQFGGIGNIKGTDLCLQAFENLKKSERSKYVLILAGRISSKNLEYYTKLVEQIGDSMQIIIKNEFCSFDFIGSVCKASDYVLLTYRKTESSSGVLGIASQFNIPVVAPSENLLGKLVRKNNLGYTLKKVDVNNIISFLRSVKPQKKWGFNQYNNSHSVESFQKTILG